MLAWVERHTPTAILIPTALATGTATALTNVPEVVSFGQELGLGVMGIGYSHTAAYIFNWLVVERPRAMALRGYYLASWVHLVELANVPVKMIDLVYGLGPLDRVARHADDATDQLSLKAQLAATDYEELAKKDLEHPRFIARILQDQQEAYEKLAPIINIFEPRVAVAITALHGHGIHRRLDQLLRHPGMLRSEPKQQHFAQALANFYQAGRLLAVALSESRYTRGLPELSTWRLRSSDLPKG